MKTSPALLTFILPAILFTANTANARPDSGNFKCRGVQAVSISQFICNDSRQSYRIHLAGVEENYAYPSNIQGQAVNKLNSFVDDQDLRIKVTRRLSPNEMYADVTSRRKYVNADMIRSGLVIASADAAPEYYQYQDYARNQRIGIWMQQYAPRVTMENQNNFHVNNALPYRQNPNNNNGPRNTAPNNNMPNQNPNGMNNGPRNTAPNNNMPNQNPNSMNNGSRNTAPNNNMPNQNPNSMNNGPRNTAPNNNMPNQNLNNNNQNNSNQPDRNSILRNDSRTNQKSNNVNHYMGHGPAVRTNNNTTQNNTTQNNTTQNNTTQNNTNQNTAAMQNTNQPVEQNNTLKNRNHLSGRNSNQNSNKQNDSLLQ